MKQRSQNVLSAIILCSLGIAIYSNIFHSSFHFDDTNSIIENQNIRNLSDLGAVFSFWPTRFITYLSLAVNYNLGKLDVFGYHLFNILVHIAASLLVYWLVRLTMQAPVIRESEISRHSYTISLLAALIFLVHPLQTQAVTYIIQRATSLAAMFYLATLCLYAKSRLSGSKAFYLSGLATGVLAMFCKEMAITLPFAILLYEHCFFKTDKPVNLKKLSPYLAILFVIPLTMFITRSVDFMHMKRVVEHDINIPIWNYLITQFRVLVTYIRLLFIPVNQNLDYQYPIFETLFRLEVLSSILLLTFIIFTAQRIFSKYRLLSFAIFFFFLTLLPESSIIPIKDVIFEHRLYLPMLGFSIFLVSGIYYFFENKTLKPMIIMLCIIISSYAILTYTRNFVWKDESTLWGDIINKSPQKIRPYNNLGLSYGQKGNFGQAISDYNKAIEINPNYTEAYNNRGIAYSFKGNFDLAISDFNKAIELNPNCVDAYNNRGNVYNDKGNFDLAISDYNKTIALDPNYTEAYNNRGNAYAQKGNFDLAISDFNKAIELSFNYAKAYNNRGNAYGQKGNFGQAISDYSKAIEINHNDSEAYNNRGNAYGVKGNFDRAISDFNKAIELDPNYAKAYNNRGNAYRIKGNFDRAISDFNKAIELDPNYAKAYKNRASMYYFRQEYAKAREDAKKAQELGYKIDPVLLRFLELQESSGIKKDSKFISGDGK